MKGKDLMNGLNFIEDQFVQEAEFTELKKSSVIDSIVKGAKSPMKKKLNWKAWGAIAACLAIVAVIGTANIMNPSLKSETPPPSQDGEVMIETANLNIYYLSENGTIESKSIEVSCTPENIFNEWATLNGVSDVTLVNSVYDDGGSEKLQGDTIEYTSGNYFKLNLTVSSEFSVYAESEIGDLLIKSLRQTFSDYIDFDEFNLIISN